MEKIKLTKAAIEALPAPDRREVLVRDSELMGFGVRVSESGSKSFFVEKKVAGKTKRITLGRCDLMTVKAARERAISFLAMMAKGEVPVDAAPPPAPAEPEKKASTLQDVLNHYLIERSRVVPPMKPTTARSYRGLIERESGLQDWLQRLPASITQAEIVERHAEITARGAAHANNVMRTLRAILNHAIDNDAFVGADGGPALVSNPVVVMKKRRVWNREVRRTRTLTQETLPRWWRIVRGLDPLDWPDRAEVIRDLWTLMLMTGMRYEEAGRIKLNLLDLEKGIIHVEDSKNRDNIELPVGAYTHELLKTRAEVSRKAGSAWLFPSPNRPVGYTSAGHDIRDILIAKSGLEWSPHDLRRTFATTLETFDISDSTIKRLMGHKIKDVTGGYIQHDITRLRSLMQRYEDLILQWATASTPST